MVAVEQVPRAHEPALLGRCDNGHAPVDEERVAEHRPQSPRCVLGNLPAATDPLPPPAAASMQRAHGTAVVDHALPPLHDDDDCLLVLIQ